MLQDEHNLRRSRMLEMAAWVKENREKRHDEILAYTRKFLENPRKGWRGRLLYSILWRAAERLDANEATVAQGKE